ncbi:MAG: hypothetical protein K0R63_914 [Rickettsiales bacterium]|jgi:hypothetical protein|nr:hypothetical protein [Rickettsiales bacterium]
MITINNPLLSNQYYQLPSDSLLSNKKVAKGTQGADTHNALQLGGLDVLDLSPEAQSYLEGLTLTSASDESATTGDNFMLTNAQRQKISEILAKYKDAPFTEDTYHQIQNDLKMAGLAPDQLALQEKVRSFNPTQVLIDALSGKEDTQKISNPLDTSDQQSKMNGYMDEIFSEWKGISTTLGALDV